MKGDGEHIAITQTKGHAMHLLFPPVLASGIYIGGGAVGLVLVVVVVVLLLRR
jgi:hypothetical protein